MKHLAYKQGMDKAAQEFGYESWEGFEKEAGPMMGVGQVGRMFAGRGAMIGAGVGAAGNMAFGDKSQGLLERGAKGAVGGGLAGAAVGGVGGALGQSRYRGQMAQSMTKARSAGASPSVIRGAQATAAPTFAGAMQQRAMAPARPVVKPDAGLGMGRMMPKQQATR